MPQVSLLAPTQQTHRPPPHRLAPLWRVVWYFCLSNNNYFYICIFPYKFAYANFYSHFLFLFYKALEATLATTLWFCEVQFWCSGVFVCFYTVYLLHFQHETMPGHSYKTSITSPNNKIRHWLFPGCEKIATLPTTNFSLHDLGIFFSYFPPTW